MKLKPRTASDGSDSKKTLPKLMKRKSSGASVSKNTSHTSKSEQIINSNNVNSNLAAINVME